MSRMTSVHSVVARRSPPNLLSESGDLDCMDADFVLSLLFNLLDDLSVCDQATGPDSNNILSA